MKKFVAVMLSCIMTCSIAWSAFGAGTYPNSVTAKMCNSSYWYDKGSLNSNQLLMTTAEIAAVNKRCLDNTAETYVEDLKNYKTDYDADARKEELQASIIKNGKYYCEQCKSSNVIYINGEQKEINDELTDTTDNYFSKLSKIPKGKWVFTDGTVKYGVCTKYALMKGLPTNSTIGYNTKEDLNDRAAMTPLCVNEPVVITGGCKINDETFYYCAGETTSGWINAEYIAICKDKVEWLNAWNIDINAKDFLVVTQDKIVTEKSTSAPSTSEVKLTVGTILKLYPDNMLPMNIQERSNWFNYVVYLPTRDEYGNYVAEPTLISQHCNVSIGFLPYTQKNVLDVAFSCLGNRYGWGGMLDATDGTAFIRSIYRCFGFDMPRNTSWQVKIPGTAIDVSKLSESNKEKLLETVPSGSLLYSAGRGIMYIGSENNTNYSIGNVSGFYDSYADSKYTTINSVAINPLTVKEDSGKTWLDAITSVVVLSGITDINKCTVTAQRACNQKDENATVSVEYGGKKLYKDINYKVSYFNGSATITGLNNFKESTKVKIGVTHTYNNVLTKATTAKNGNITCKCKNCGAVKSKTTVYKAKTIKLASKKYDYTGKKITPKTTVKDSKGKALKKGTDYTVTYQKGRKKAGTYKVTIKLKGNYSGKKVLKFKIKPAVTAEEKTA